MLNEEFEKWTDDVEFSWTGTVENLLLWASRLNLIAKKVKSVDPEAVIKIETGTTGVSVFCSPRIFYDNGGNLPTVG